VGLFRPLPLASGAVAMAVIGWLLLFTPGTLMPAAERQAAEWQRDDPLPASRKPRGPVSSSSPAAVTPDVLRELEVDVLTVLQLRHALSGQRIQVTRTPAGVTVEGLVEGGDRDALVRALRALPHGAALRVNLTTPADLMGTGPAAGTSTPSSLRAVALGRDAIPAADDLRRAVVSREGGKGASNVSIENVEAGIHRIANDGLRYARTAFLEAATLSTLADRLDAARAADIPERTSEKWRVLLTEQANRVERGVYQMRTLLEPVFLTYDDRAALRAQPQPAPGAQAVDRPGPGGEARRIAEDLREVEQATRAALAVAEVAPGTIELRERAFWRRLAATGDRIAAFRQQLMSR
jgi:hypothetical protein